MMNATFLTYQQILELPFTHKLWLLIHLSYYDFIRWNDDGTIILLDLAGLEVYLNSSCSIFNIENHSAFLQYLEVFQFERLDTIPQAGDEILLQYRNKYFQQYRLEVMPKIPETDVLQSIVLYQNEARILQELFKISGEKVNHEFCYKPSVVEVAQKIDVSMDLFESPNDPALQYMNECQTNYIGFNESYNKDGIMHVVGDYLPKYDNAIMELEAANFSEMNKKENLNNVQDKSFALLVPAKNYWPVYSSEPPPLAPLSQPSGSNQGNINFVKQFTLTAQEQRALLSNYDSFAEIVSSTDSFTTSHGNSIINNNNKGNNSNNDNNNSNSNSNSNNNSNSNSDSNTNCNNENDSNVDDPMNEYYKTYVGFLASLGLMYKPKNGNQTTIPCNSRENSVFLKCGMLKNERNAKNF